MPLPRITAHDPPDHQKALAEGADLIEVDLRVSARGELVLSHDAIVGDGAGLTTLESVWDAPIRAGKGFNLDVKEEAALEPLAAFLEARIAGPGTVVTGCNAAWVSRLRERVKDVPVLLNVGVGPAPDERPQLWGRRVITEAHACNASGLNVDVRVLTPGLAFMARSFGLSLFVWTVNGEDALGRVFALGVDGITTDEVALAHRILTAS